MKVSTNKLDQVDFRILSELQHDGRLSNAELADRTHTSPSVCWRRTRRLEQQGVIAGYQVRVNPRAIGLEVMAYASVRIDSHSDRDSKRFAEAVAAYPEVVACHAIAGSFDFMLVIMARNLDAYEDFAMKRLRKLPGIREINTSIVLKEIKPAQGVPLPGRIL